MKYSLVSILFTLITLQLQAQVKDSLPPIEQEDFSIYENVEVAGNANTIKYCTSKILGGSPSRIFSIGYDYQLPYSFTAGQLINRAIAEEKSNVTAQGLRISANVPIISNTKWLISLGANYWQTNYDYSSSVIHPLNAALNHSGLNTMGVNSTLFKPLNGKHFILAQPSFDWSGNFDLFKTLPDQSLRVSATVLFGWKKHDRSMFAVGVTRTFRAGQVNYLPVILYNYTYPNRKWGYEILFPARAHVRYNLNARNLLFVGYELEGANYFLPKLNAITGNELTDAYLRRSELRFRLNYDFSIYNFLWLSVQAGLRLNYVYNVDQGEFFRSITSDRPYMIENKMGITPYFNISLNLVSP